MPFRHEHRALGDHGPQRLTTAGSCCSTLAALQAIPTDVYRATALVEELLACVLEDHLPLLKPAHFFVLVVFGIGALKIFDQAFIVSNGTGGPQNSTYTMVLYIYLKAFHGSDFGIAASAGVVMFIGILFLTVIMRATIGRAEIG